IQQTKIDTEYLVPKLSGVPYKQQGVVAAKYHIGSLNFLLSLTPNNRARIAYIAHDKHNSEFFESFLETLKKDYKTCGPQLQATLEKPGTDLLGY
ncbi:31600_t:CDS:2, partial [Racocetra persica]